LGRARDPDRLLHQSRSKRRNDDELFHLSPKILAPSHRDHTVSGNIFKKPTVKFLTATGSSLTLHSRTHVVSSKPRQSPQ
jgi:hypothetical protein